MAKTKTFDDNTSRYEMWFSRNEATYLSELEAIRDMLPGGRGVEIGVGTGLFAAPLGIKTGIEPSKNMRRIASERGIEVLDGVAEDLPFSDGSFDFALMVTTICFVDDINASFREARRVLKPEGSLIVAFVDRESPLGMKYQEHRMESEFYMDATFFTVDELVYSLKKAGFMKFMFNQTIFHEPELIDDVEPFREGYGEGSFVVIRADLSIP